MRTYNAASYAKMQQEAARAIDALDSITGNEFPRPDFHTLSSRRVDRVLHYADTWGKRPYRKPKNANGSRARYFYAYLLRIEGRIYQDHQAFIREVGR